MPLKTDRHRLQHMLDAAEEARGFSEGRTRTDLDRERLLALALVRLVELVGEAATRVTEETRGRHPEIPWRAILGMRNRLIHSATTIGPLRMPTFRYVARLTLSGPQRL